MSELRCKCPWWCGQDCQDKERMQNFGTELPEVKSYPPMPQVKPIQRKIVQISARSTPSDDVGLYALCNDGVVFQTWDGGWSQLPPIPQPED